MNIETSPIDSLPVVLGTNHGTARKARACVGGVPFAQICETVALAERVADRLRSKPHISDVLVVDAVVKREPVARHECAVMTADGIVASED